MALQIAYTDTWGNTYPEAYVVLRIIVIDKIAKHCNLKFGVYPNRKTREDNPGPVLAAIDVLADGDAFDTLMETMDTSGRKTLYAYAKGINDSLSNGEDV